MPTRSLLLATVLLAFGSVLKAEDITLLNVSYDPTRELYAEINPLFAADFQKSTGKSVKIDQSHGGSGKQARAVIDGLRADVVTLALAGDIDSIADKGKQLPKDWQSRLPKNSTPSTSTIVFLVRKGNPKAIKDWGDLVKPGIDVITPNPKTSGGARWNYLAAWGWAKKQHGGSDEKAQAFVKDLFSHVPVLDTGARGATTTFVQRGLGDALLAWENEAYLAVKESPNEVEIVTPSLSILAEPPVAVIDRVVKKKGTQEAAEAYLKFLYTPAAQEIIAKHFYRPTDPTVAAKYVHQFKPLELVTIADFGGWAVAQKTHFADGGTFDRISAR